MTRTVRAPPEDGPGLWGAWFRLPRPAILRAASEVSVSLRGPLVEDRFVEPPNRFVVHARLGGGEVAVAQLADPGRLRELLRPGRRLWLREADESALKARKTRWSVALVAAPGGELVSVDTGVPNRLIGEAVRRDALPELGDFGLERAEYSLGRSRIDFLLRPREGEGGLSLLLETKSVTLVEEGVGASARADQSPWCRSAIPDPHGQRRSHHSSKLPASGYSSAGTMSDQRETRWPLRLRSM